MAHSYEKTLFFIPNRLYVSGTQLYVSFNIAVIPIDMDITSVKLHVPLPERSSAVQVELREVAGGWDENHIVKVQPKLREAALLADVSPGKEEVQFEVTHLADKWRFISFDNHGLHIKLLAAMNKELSLTDDKPPYLLVATV